MEKEFEMYRKLRTLCTEHNIELRAVSIQTFKNLILLFFL